MIPSSWRRSATSSVCIWRRVPWSLCHEKSQRPWTVPSHSCRCAPGRQRRSLDYKRHCTTSLFAALDIARERSSANVSRAIGPEVANSSTSSRRTSLVISTSTSSWTGPTRPRRSATGSRPRLQAHFTPTSASWLNHVERWFADRQADQARQPSLHQGVLLDYIDTTNQNPKPFKWTKSADDILGAIQRVCLPSKSLNSRRRTSESLDSRRFAPHLACWEVYWSLHSGCRPVGRARGARRRGSKTIATRLTPETPM